ncbi:MAG: glycosyltransferase family 2 protein [Planctomycetota bacterium]
MKISIVIPVKNGEAFLKECLDGIFAQKIDAELEVLAVDSGSTDATPDILAGYPVRVIPINPYEFDHGDTRNLGAAESDGDVIVFFVQDAVPESDQWLARLVKNLERDPDVAGAFSRVIPRRDCGPLVERGVRGDLNFGEKRVEMRYDGPFAPEEWDPHTRRVRSNFNDVASALRRSVWEKIPYQRTAFGEDIVWADSVLRAGYKVVFDPEATVIHSHEYQPFSIYPRTHIDGWFNRSYFQRFCIEKPSHVFIMTGRQFKEDREFLETKGLERTLKWKETFTSLFYHFFEFTGFYLGGQKEGELPCLWPVDEGSLKIFHIVSDSTLSDPEEASRVLETARELQALGHGVTFLRNGGAEKNEKQTPSEWEGIPTHDLEGRFDPWDPRSIRLSRELERTLERLVLDEEPDVVHCADFRPFSAQVVEFCLKQGIPCVVSLNDFWFRCPRGDLIRPDGTFCDLRKPPRLGCTFCLAGQPEFIFPSLLIDKGLGIKTFARFRNARTDVLLKRLDQAAFVLVPDPFFRQRCMEAGLDERRVVPLTRPTSRLLYERLGPALDPYPEQRRLLSSAGESYDAMRTARQWVVKYKQAVGQAAFSREAATHSKAQT